MIKPKKLPSDVNQRAQHIAKLLTGELMEEPEPERSAVSAYLAEIGRKGGNKGGVARRDKLSAKRRMEIAKRAASVRWRNPESA
jgi:hypothetical protein